MSHDRVLLGSSTKNKKFDKNFHCAGSAHRKVIFLFSLSVKIFLEFHSKLNPTGGTSMYVHVHQTRAHRKVIFLFKVFLEFHSK
jgi:hypothetical protein